MKIEIVERSPVRVACRRYTGPFGEPLGRFWRADIIPWLADHGLLDAPRYGVTLDDPIKTPPAGLRYDACVELPADVKLPDAEEGAIAGGTYAVAAFKGTRGQIQGRWADFLGACLSLHRPDLVRRPFEHYPRGALFDSKSGMFCCELCLPVSS